MPFIHLAVCINIIDALWGFRVFRVAPPAELAQNLFASRISGVAEVKLIQGLNALLTQLDSFLLVDTVKYWVQINNSFF